MEEMTVSTCKAIRCSMGWRAQKGLRMNMGSPNRIDRLSIAEGGGDVRSTVDTQDNITWEEGRDITINNCFR